MVPFLSPEFVVFPHALVYAEKGNAYTRERLVSPIPSAKMI
jgi:hypothetical protein